MTTCFAERIHQSFMVVHPSVETLHGTLRLQIRSILPGQFTFGSGCVHFCEIIEIIDSVSIVWILSKNLKSELIHQVILIARGIEVYHVFSILALWKDYSNYFNYFTQKDARSSWHTPRVEHEILIYIFIYKYIILDPILTTSPCPFLIEINEIIEIVPAKTFVVFSFQ